MISVRDMEEFMDYLDICTDAQVLGVLAKERAANRKEYIVLAEKEAEKRRIFWARERRD
jgi:hypothetical protein